MAARGIHSSALVIRAKWLRGWALMRAGKTSEGYEQLAGVTFSDLQAISDVEHPERVAMRVQSIIERQPRAEGDDDCLVMEALVRAGKRGDHDASDLLVFGDLQEEPAE
jgi:hypothetical protein